jgi:RimJ/RimL family protein N-acetyltransferase
MKDLPESFHEVANPLRSGELGELCDEAIKRLAEQGYEVRLGLTPDYTRQIRVMAHEKAIKKYCPRDSSERFANEASTKTWLSKGRAAFLLIKKGSSDESNLVGYGWSGRGKSDYAPNSQSTFAIRIGEAGQGQGLATPFSQLVVFGSHAIYGIVGFWLETWESNGGAVHIYHKLGFKDVARVEGQRLDSSGGKESDARLYMTLANDLLPSLPS